MATKPGCFINSISIEGRPDPFLEQWLNELPEIGFLPPKTPKKWEHDCPQCKHQGSLVIDEQHYDFYICDGHGAFPLGRSFIARYGGGPGYTSFPEKLIPDLQLGMAGAAEGVLQTLEFLERAEWKSEKFGFAVVPDQNDLNSVHVVVNPLGEPRVIRYVSDAVALAGPLFQYKILDREMLHAVVQKISELVHAQLVRDR